MPRGLTSGDLARRTGNSLRTVRFYEEAGLLRPQRRAGRERRNYTEDDLVRLELITDLKNLGLSLDDIKDVLEVKNACTNPREVRERLGELIRAQIELATERMNALRRLKNELAASLDRLEDCVGCERPMITDSCANCDVATCQTAPRLVRVVLGRQKPCSGFFSLASLRKRGSA